MVDRAQSLAPADLRMKFVRTVADLAQLDDSKLPDGARVILQQEDPASAAVNLTGQREFVFTRLPAPAAPALNFSLANGAQATPTRNVYLSKSGYLWVGWPQSFQVTLAGGSTDIDDVVTHVGSGAAVQQMRIDWRRLSLGGTPDFQVLFSVSDNQLTVLHTALDTSVILVNAYAVFNYP